MQYDVIIDKPNTQKPTIFAYGSHYLSIYNLTQSVFGFDKPHIPYEALTSYKLDEDALVKVRGKDYYVNGTTFNLSVLRDWKFGTVYAIVEYVGGVLHKAFYGLANISPYMQWGADTILDGFVNYRTASSCQMNLCGFLIVVSKNQNVQDNILVTIMTEEARELSLHEAKRYENFGLWDCLVDVESMCLPSIDIEHPNHKPYTLMMESVQRSSDGWATMPIQINEPYVMRFYFNTKIVTAYGFLPYYSINCNGYGQIIVNDDRIGVGQSFLTIERPNEPIMRQNLNPTPPRIVTLWLYRHSYDLIKEYRGNETKVQYYCYY